MWLYISFRGRLKLQKLPERLPERQKRPNFGKGKSKGKRFHRYPKGKGKGRGNFGRQTYLLEDGLCTTGDDYDYYDATSEYYGDAEEEYYCDAAWNDYGVWASTVAGASVLFEETGGDDQQPHSTTYFEDSTPTAEDQAASASDVYKANDTFVSFCSY